MSSIIRVLVVDDSAFMRRAITKMLTGDDSIEVIGSVGDGQQAVDAVKTLNPDVVTLDIEMPVMDGLTALDKIMAEMPTPVVMLSSVLGSAAWTTRTWAAPAYSSVGCVWAR